MIVEIVKPLNGAAKERYLRQIAIPQIGEKGQAELAGKRVLVVGAGGLGTPCATYLAGMGTGHIRLVDDDTVSLSNLPRQVLYDTSDIAKHKAFALRKKLLKANPTIDVEPVITRLDAQNAKILVEDRHAVASCVDNLDTRYLLNDACLRASVPFVDAGVAGFSGLVTTVVPGRGPCYRCIFPEESPGSFPPTGIFGPAAGVAGAIQAGEILKLLLGIGDPLTGKMLLFNLLQGDFRSIPAPRRPSCKACGNHFTL